MLSEKYIREELKELEKEYEADEKADYDHKLPCCDYRELESSIALLRWILEVD